MCLWLAALNVDALARRSGGGNRTSSGYCVAPSKLAHGIRLADPKLNANSRASKFVWKFS